MPSSSHSDAKYATTASEWSDVRPRLARIAAASTTSTRIHGADSHSWVLEPPLSIMELSEIEAQLRVQLPDEYRSFLLQAGRGGAGPHYGVFPLRKVNGRWQWDSDIPGLTDMDRIREPFPHTEAIHPLDIMPVKPKEEDFETTEAFHSALGGWQQQWIIGAPENSAGLLYLCDLGCALRHAIVVSGPARGQMWADRVAEDAGYEPLFDNDGTPLAFTGWYKRWLDEVERKIGMTTSPDSITHYCQKVVVNEDYEFEMWDDMEKNELLNIHLGATLADLMDASREGCDLAQYDNALQAASIIGHEKVVRLLLEKGADVNTQGGYYDSALQAASCSAHEKVVELLPKKGADDNAQGRYYVNALQAASVRGHEKVVELLLAKGADANAQGGYYGSALYAASVGGHEKMVGLLLAKGADVNAQGGYYGNAMQAASVEGHEEVVELLLGKGANINAQGGKYGTALQAASHQDHEEVVELLLKEGADVNAQGGRHGTALHAASHQGHKEIVEMLLKEGADVNAQGRRYGTALYAASHQGHKEIVEMLLKEGADVNAQGRRCGTALQAASHRGHKEIVEMLLKEGADVNAQGRRYGTALQAALHRGHKEVVEMLVGKGVDLNAQGGNEPTTAPERKQTYQESHSVEIGKPLVRTNRSRNSTKTIKHPCRICQTIADSIGDWEYFQSTHYDEQMLAIATWESYCRSAKNCMTCRRIVQHLSSPRYMPFSPTCKVAIQEYEGTLWFTSDYFESCRRWPEGSDHLHGGLTLLRSQAQSPDTQHYTPVWCNTINLDTIRGWVTQCNQEHQGLCHEFSQFSAFELPPWLILIDVEEQCLVKLFKNVKYLCLSYVWGKNNRDPFQTTKANLQELQQRGSLQRDGKRLPRTVKDAMNLTGAMGCRYLWVDRFCIVQDDDEQVHQQMSWMASIYANSHFTIIAAEGPDAEYGIPGIGHGSSPRSFKYDIFRFDGSEEFAVEIEEEKAPWHTRAWTFQERLLSRRCLIFHQQTVKWECKRTIACETKDKVPSSRTFFNRWSLNLLPYPTPSEYGRLVQIYSEKQLTFSHDVLAAFSAVISAFTRSFPSGFFFALPEFFFDMALLWTVKTALTRRENFPTWSWLGWEGLVEPYGYYCWNATFVSSYGPNHVCEPMVQWSKQCGECQGVGHCVHDKSGCLFLPVDNSYHKWQEYGIDHNRTPPPGWQLSDDIYVHERLNAEDFKLHPSNKHYHPVPVQDTPLSIEQRSWLPFLYGQVKSAIFQIGISFYQDDKSQSDKSLSFHLENADGEWVGIIESHYSELKHCQKGDQCEVVGISYGSSQNWGDDDHPYEMTIRDELEDYRCEKYYEYVNVLWIHWKDEIAYRQGIGRIWRHLWDDHEKREIDIVLG